MVNLREVYRQAEEHTTLMIIGLFVLLGLLILLQSFFSGLMVLAAVVGIVFVGVSVLRPEWTLGFLAVYLPFESFILKWMPDDIYLFARYFSEVLIYVLAGVVLVRILSGSAKMRQTRIDFPFILFLIALVSTAIINAVSPTVAILGMRQILRFMIVFFIVVYLYPTKDFIRSLTTIMFGIVMVSSVIGISQALIGAPLDEFLLPAEARTYGDITLTSGTTQFWDPGSRVFATFGRYDRLGNFLYFFLLIGVGYLYEKYIRKEKKNLWLLFALGIPTLLLTFSRSSWFAFLLGFLFIGIAIRKDRRVMAAFATFLIVVTSYLALSGLQVRFITESAGQTITERFYESFSYARWRGEYYGLGRLFWIVQTPLTVIPASPIFGFGPGQYGGGVVAALGNTRVYEELGIPFGVFGTDGYIDNNWFSLWGEVGTLGMLFYLWIYIGLFAYSVRLYFRSRDAVTRAIAIGFAAAMIGVAFNAFLSTLLEIRTLAFYLWLYAGFVVVLGMRERKRKKRQKKKDKETASEPGRLEPSA